MTTDEALKYVDRVAANGPGTVPTEDVLRALAAEVRRLRSEIETNWAHQALEAECASLREQLREASAVCACGHPDSDHEHYGEDGLTHDCEHDCIRVSPAVASVIVSLRDQIRLLREASSEQDVRFAGVESERDHYRNALAKVSAHAPDGTISCGQCGANLGSDGMVEALTDTMQQLVAVEAERDALTKRWEDLRDWTAKTVPDYYVARWIRGYVTLQTTTLAKMNELEDQR